MGAAAGFLSGRALLEALSLCFCRRGSPSAAAAASALRLPRRGVDLSMALAWRTCPFSLGSASAAAAFSSPSAASFSHASTRCKYRRFFRLIPAYLSRFGFRSAGFFSAAAASSAFLAEVGCARVASLTSARSWAVWNHERGGRESISSRCSIMLEALFASISATRSSFSSRSSSSSCASCGSTAAICSCQKEIASCATTRVCTAAAACLSTDLRKARSPSPTRETARPARPARAVRPTRWT
mmetsp:Transcript_2972/g.6731  ORF Transcript_2972/g.6731 Transcript_2972/m.6731 type:complete len:242 (+) Transcript_2972:202-927(+)